MTRSMTAAMEAALLRSANHLVVLVKMETDTTPIRVWSGSGDLVFNTETYSGVGEFGSITRSSETLELAASGIQLALSGIPASFISSALTDVRQGRNVTVWIGVVKNRLLDNIVSNGFFDNNITGWTNSSTGDGSIAWNAAGYIDVIDGTTGEGIADQQLTGLTTGKEYVLFYEVKDAGANGARVTVGTTQGLSNLFLPGASDLLLKKHKVFFTPTVTNPWIRLEAEGALSNDTVSFDNIIVLENDPVPLIDDPVVAFQGQTDSVIINEGKETSQIVVNVENRLLRLEKNNERRYTKQDQERIDAGDKGFDFVESIQEKEILWGRP